MTAGMAGRTERMEGSSEEDSGDVVGGRSEPLSVLVSAYACGPHWGSEIGMGWNWVTHLARYCRLRIITECEFRDYILDAIGSLHLAYAPRFHFIDIGEKARRRCWNSGDWRFYVDYRRWQLAAYRAAKDLASTESFDVVHQLNMIGYREPGFLWRLRNPFVWGPIGGHVQMPWRFLPMLGPSGMLYNTARNVVNALQMRLSRRVRLAARRADVLIAATAEDQAALTRIHRRPCILLNEQGATVSASRVSRELYGSARPLRLVWCGTLMSSKALPIALGALAQASRKTNLELHIIGEGHQGPRWRAQAARLSIERFCHWHGRVEHTRCLAMISRSDCMLVSSLKEAASTVVLESLSLGVPVICHDMCGFGAVVNDTCGIKVPVISPRHSVEGFASAIVFLATHPETLARLSEGALRRARELSWDQMARRMVQAYRDAIRDACRRDQRTS